MACDKVSYSNKQDALNSISGIQRRFMRTKRKPVQAYNCDQCGGWHITSNRVRPHLPKSITKELHTSDPRRECPLKIIDLTWHGFNNTMARLCVLLLPMSIMISASASGFSDSRASKETTFQVHACDYDFALSLKPKAISTLDVEVPAELVIYHPALGQRSAIENLIEEKTSEGYLCSIRGPPDSCIQKSA
jgi:hypothetical protein